MVEVDTNVWEDFKMRSSSI